MIVIDSEVQIENVNSNRKRASKLRYSFCMCLTIVCPALWQVPPPSTEKCPTGWHHYEKTASCYKVYLRRENYWKAGDVCQKVNGSLATFVTNEELQFILKIEVDFDDEVCERRDQCKWVLMSLSAFLFGLWLNIQAWNQPCHVSVTQKRSQLSPKTF